MVDHMLDTRATFEETSKLFLKVLVQILHSYQRGLSVLVALPPSQHMIYALLI